MAGLTLLLGDAFDATAEACLLSSACALRNERIKWVGREYEVRSADVADRVPKMEYCNCVVGFHSICAYVFANLVNAFRYGCGINVPIDLAASWAFT